MDVRIDARAHALCGALADHARRSVSLRLRRWQAQVRCVDVRVGGSTRPLDGNGTWCVIRLQMAGADAATIVDIADDSATAIERAAGRAARLAEEQMLAAGRTRAAA